MKAQIKLGFAPTRRAIFSAPAAVEPVLEEIAPEAPAQPEPEPVPEVEAEPAQSGPEAEPAPKKSLF